MPGTALQPHSDNSGFTLSHIPRHNSVVQAIDASGQNVSHTFELAWARGLHLHSLCFSVPGTQSSGATCFPCCHSKQLMWACVCVSPLCQSPQEIPLIPTNRPMSHFLSPRYPIRILHQHHSGRPRDTLRHHRRTIQGQNGLPGNPRRVQSHVHSHGPWKLPD